MYILSIISYVIGAILLGISCFTISVSVTWWLGGIAVFFLILGCVFQYNASKHKYSTRHRHN